MNQTTITFTVTHPRQASILAAVAVLLDDPGERTLGLVGCEQPIRDLIQELYSFMASGQSELFFDATRVELQKWTPTIRALHMMTARLEEFQEHPTQPLTD